MAVLQVQEPTWARHIGVSYRKDACLPPAVMRLTGILETAAAQIVAEPP